MGSVAVVGAGFAGLAAAVSLRDAGVDVVVYEARDRVGGRVWSQRLDGESGPIIERGAEFVLDGYDHMRDWLERYGLELADTGMSYYVREPRGIAGVTADDMRAGAEVVAAMPRPLGASVADLLAEVALRPEVVEAIRARVETSEAYGAAALSPDVLDRVASFVPLPSYRVSGGNQSLALAMAADLGDRVRLSAPVTGVAWADDGVVVTTDRGESAHDAVILTVPLPLLRDFPLSPPLPPDRAEALGRCVMGVAAKCHVGLREDAPTSAVISVPGRFWCWTATVADGSVAPVLNVFAGSPDHVAALRPDEGPDHWLTLLRELRPDLTLDEASVVVTTWLDDPWARGAYTADAIGRLPGDDELLRAPLGRLHFAGEHTAGEWASLMEGALRSGTRAADEVAAVVGAARPPVV